MFIIQTVQKMLLIGNYLSYIDNLSVIDKIKLYNKKVEEGVKITSSTKVEIEGNEWNIGRFIDKLIQKYSKNKLTNDESELLKNNKDWKKRITNYKPRNR